jgi:RNA polymerase sigma-70 factor (ECF subfamily)
MDMQKPTFETLLLENIPRMERYCLFLAKDKIKAEDILQESLYKAIKYKYRFTEGTNLIAWLNTIIKNAFYDSLNSRQTRAEQNTDYFGEIQDFSLLNSSVKNEAMENLNIEILTKVIDSLEDKYKIPFVMAFRGFKYKEIAARQKVPIGTVKAHIFRAREIIKQQLKFLGYENITS